MVWSPDYEDAPATYIAAVEAADGQGLEEEVKAAYTEFILGCISDGIWDAIKASCILSGARTLAGALVPLVGTVAPTNNGPFLAADYDRKTGLVGDGTTKYLDSNRNNTADPQDDKHLSVFVSTDHTRVISGTYAYIGSTWTSGTSGASHIITNNTYRFFRANNTLVNTDLKDRIADTSSIVGFTGFSRSSSTEVTTRFNNVDYVLTDESSPSQSNNITVFARSGSLLSSSRIAFYSIGESLDLAKLDTRVTDLITAIGAAIP